MHEAHPQVFGFLLIVPGFILGDDLRTVNIGYEIILIAVFDLFHLKNTIYPQEDEKD